MRTREGGGRGSRRDVINAVTSGQVWSIGGSLAVRAATIESVSTEMCVGWWTPEIISTISRRYTISTTSELRLLPVAQHAEPVDRQQLSK